MRPVLICPLLLGFALPLGVAEPPPVEFEASFTFSLARVEGSQVVFQGGAGCRWTEVSYSGNSFVVYDAGVAGPADRPDVAHERGMAMSLLGETLNLTCRARECAVHSLTASGRREKWRLEEGETSSVSASSTVAITVSK